MRVVGKTTEGQLVLADIAALYFQEGLPLSVIFEHMKKRNLQPSFPHLYTELKGNGLTHERIIHLLHEHVFEAYGKEYRDVVLQKLEKFKIQTTKV